MKKTLIIVGGSIVVLGVLGFVFKDKIKAKLGKGGEEELEEEEEDEDEGEVETKTGSIAEENPYEDLIQVRIDKIKKNKAWMAKIPAQAKARKVSNEKMLRISAIWWLKNKEKTIPMSYKG